MHVEIMWNIWRSTFRAMFSTALTDFMLRHVMHFIVQIIIMQIKYKYANYAYTLLWEWFPFTNLFWGFTTTFLYDVGLIIYIGCAPNYKMQWFFLRSFKTLKRINWVVWNWALPFQTI